MEKVAQGGAIAPIAQVRKTPLWPGNEVPNRLICNLTSLVRAVTDRASPELDLRSNLEFHLFQAKVYHLTQIYKSNTMVSNL